MYTVYCILYTVYCILYTVYCMLYTVYYKVFSSRKNYLSNNNRFNQNCQNHNFLFCIFLFFFPLIVNTSLKAFSEHCFSWSCKTFAFYKLFLQYLVLLASYKLIKHSPGIKAGMVWKKIFRDSVKRKRKTLKFYSTFRINYFRILPFVYVSLLLHLFFFIVFSSYFITSPTIN